ncbi:ParB/RepB/Spo0J family partition protein [Butyrivibrio sp. INlla16]|uniref:ParB/RepB/Spo0J family partition protein n=1 Tax=Butyrivibrio sp. INlla16 TaxID=1520807 RepID=UPI000884E15D|nr:ParB/RepB/Spo0J family partition protein [Butyrivibrio sp. INlla16]SDB14162.1 chromosome partitioning protein, ParB family [Butyrivibrio sp. INlla16]
MAAKREKIHFESVDELLGAPSIKDGTEEIRIDKIHPFKDHPFKVVDDDKMAELVESIKTNGILSPVLVRPDNQGGYEMVSGHRRMHAAKLAGLEVVPAIVKEMTDDESVIVMVDSNVQREEILPSERAYSLKMKMDVVKRQGRRTDLEDTSGTECRKLTGDAVGEEFGLRDRQVRKYVKLTDLIPELMQMVDEKVISIGMGYDISFFDKEVQQWIYEYRKENGILRPEQIEALKAQKNLENMQQYPVIQVLNSALPEPKTNGKVSLSERKLNKYFPSHMPSREREKVILELLAKWKEEQEEMADET